MDVLRRLKEMRSPVWDEGRTRACHEYKVAPHDKKGCGIAQAWVCRGSVVMMETPLVSGLEIIYIHGRKWGEIRNTSIGNGVAQQDSHTHRQADCCVGKRGGRGGHIHRASSKMRACRGEDGAEDSLTNRVALSHATGSSDWNADPDETMRSIIFPELDF